MRNALFVAAGTLLVLGAGVAVADSIGSKAIKPASATVGVTSVVQKKLRTCSGSDGTLSSATLEIGGTAASSEPSLNGPAKLTLNGVVDSGRDAGTVSGSLRIDVASGRDTVARFAGVYAKGKIHGLLEGSAAKPYQRVRANLSADFNAATGQLSNLKIGQTDAGGAAVLIQPGTCKATPTVAQRVEVTGIVSAVSPEAITVAGVTCFFPQNAKPVPGMPTVLHEGDRVEMTCAMQNQRLVVEKLKRLR